MSYKGHIDKDYEKISRWPPAVEIDEQYIFLHSISHILMKEFAIQSGYEDASISERIYSSENMRGILIYTTSSGDGSLGGFSSSGGLGLKKRLLNLEQ